MVTIVKWGRIEYPPRFRRDTFPVEAYIADIDVKMGTSLKVSKNLNRFFSD